MRSAVLFLIFNRPDHTLKVFEAIRSAQPPRLYIVADGPRIDRVGEAELCDKTRRVVSHIDWTCEVKTLYRDQNLGCKTSVSQGISWFFENESEGIILEDDCLPSPSFFVFMDEMLERYRHDAKVGCVNGNNVMGDLKGYSDTYFFTVNANVWGWGTWKRVWELYDLEMNKWPSVKDSKLIDNLFVNKEASKFWSKVFQKTYDETIKTWDFQFVFLVFLNNLLCIQPYRNLISNIGFGPDATITKDMSSSRANQAIGLIKIPIKHPSKFNRSLLIEDWDSINYFGFSNKVKRLIRKLKFLIV